MWLLILGLILFIGLVVVHELGHFWAARRNGVEIEEFGIFFPPKLWGKKMKSGFEFTVNALPLGGFVKLKGEYDSDRRPGTFGSASLWAKVKIMLAGVFINLVTAIGLFTILALVGMPQIFPNQFKIASDARQVNEEKTAVIIGNVQEGSLAEKAGIKAGDKLLSVGAVGEEANNITKADEFIAFTGAHQGQEMTVKYERDGKVREVTSALRSAEEIAEAKKRGKEIGAFGVSLGNAVEEIGVVRHTWSAPIVALGTTAQLTQLTFEGLGKALAGLGGIIAGAVTGNSEARQSAQTTASSQVGGPVAIFMTLKEGSRLGVAFVLTIIAYISLMLAIMNVLPIPALDGGRLFVMLIARLIKKPLTPKVEEWIYGTGFIFLLALIVLITIVDVKRFF